MGTLNNDIYLFFDLFYTLNIPSHCPGENEYSILGLTRAEWTAYSEAADLYRPRATGRIRDPETILRSILSVLPFSVPEEQAQKVLRFRTDRMRRCLCSVPGDVLSVLACLKSEGKHLILLSNANCIDTCFWDSSPLRPLMDSWVFSWQAGLMKPDPRIYRLAAEKAGADLTRSAFIGDGGSDELAGAHAAGMHAVLSEVFDIKPEPLRSELRRNADALITEFSQLLNLFL